jgi:hypothetical protein
MGYVLPRGSSKLRPGDAGYRELPPLPPPVKIPPPPSQFIKIPVFTYSNGCPILEKE